MKQQRRHDRFRGGGHGLVIATLLALMTALGLGCSGGAAPSAQANEPQAGAAEGTAEQAANAPQEHAGTGVAGAETGPAEASAPREDTDSPAPDEHADTPAPAPSRSPDTDREPSPTDRRKVDALVAEAKEAALKGQYGRARKLCEQALELQPREPRAVNICATSACGLRNARLAKRYYDQAIESEQRLIQRYCSAKGIELAPAAP